MHIKTTLVMTQQQYNTLLVARDIVKKLGAELEDDETIGNTDNLDIEDIADSLDLLVDVGVIDGGSVNFEVRRM